MAYKEGSGPFRFIGRVFLLMLLVACLDLGHSRLFTQEKNLQTFGNLPKKPTVGPHAAPPRIPPAIPGGASPRMVGGTSPGSPGVVSTGMAGGSAPELPGDLQSSFLPKPTSGDLNGSQDSATPSPEAVVKPAEEGPEAQSAAESPFERQVEEYNDPIVGLPILQFGYDVFSRPQQPLLDAPVGGDYVLGVGDNLVLSIWGNIDQDYRPTIDRDGQIRLPMIGPIPLKGLTIERAEAVLKQKFDRVYENYQLQLRLGKIRDMPVHVIGRVASPGRVRVPSVATLFDALSAAGGITKDGTLRRIILRRSGEPDRQIDLYSYLLRGDLSVDISLSSNDAVVVPAVGTLVAIVGRVLRPAIYEIDGEQTSFAEILSMAGGFARLADRNDLQIESVANSGPSIRTVNLRAISAERITLRDGEVAVVKSANPKLENVVYISGNVSLPGRYAFTDGMRVSDLITEETLIDAGFWSKRRVPDPAVAYETFPEPFLEYALIRRIHPRTQQESRIAFHLGKAIFEKDPAENHLLQSQDTLVIFPRSTFEVPPTVFVTGAVNKPGSHGYFPGMRVLDLIRMAGDLLPEAYLASAMLTRIHPDQEGTRFEHISVDLREIATGNEEANFLLQRDDSLAVKVVPEYRKVYRVTIEGEVRQPGDYTVIPGERLSDLLRRAGGFTRDAYLPAAHFYRESVRKVQQERLEESLRRLELETKLAAQKYTAEAAALYESPPTETKTVQEEQARIEKLVSTIRATPAKGRLVIRLRPPDELAGSSDDVVLEDRDRLTIPRQPQEVQVIGAVFNQTALLYQNDFSARRYLDACGGPTDSAETSLIFIIRADGSAESAESARSGFRWDDSRGRFSRGNLLESEMRPGDTLVVPYDVKPQLSKLGLTKTIIQILFQAAMSTGIIVALL